MLRIKWWSKCIDTVVHVDPMVGREHIVWSISYAEAVECRYLDRIKTRAGSKLVESCRSRTET